MGDVVIPLRDATSGNPRGAVTLACLDADDGTRYFFGPLLVRASGAKRSHSLYRKIRLMTTRRIATDAEMTFVRRRRPDLWETVMRERHTQVEQEANKDTRQRRQRQRRRAAERAMSQPIPSVVSTAAPQPPTLPTRLHPARRQIVFHCSADRVNNDGKDSNGDDDDCALVIDDKDDEGDETTRARTTEAPSATRASTGPADEEEEDNDVAAGDGDDDDGDGDYDADGVGDLVPLMPLPRRQPAHVTGAAAAVTADTIYLVEATSCLIEFLGNDVIGAAPGNIEDNNNSNNANAKSDGRDGLAPVSARRGVKRPWEDVLADVTAWAAARDVVLVDWMGCGVEDTSLGAPPHLRRCCRQRRRKQAWPIRALKPFGS